MKSYLAGNRQHPWDPEQGPWAYTSSDYWANRALRLTEESPEWAAYVKSHGPWDEDGDLTPAQEKKWWQAFDKISSRFDPHPELPTGTVASGPAIGWPAGIAQSANC